MPHTFLDQKAQLLEYAIVLAQNLWLMRTRKSHENETFQLPCVD